MNAIQKETEMDVEAVKEGLLHIYLNCVLGVSGSQEQSTSCPSLYPSELWYYRLVDP